MTRGLREFSVDGVDAREGTRVTVIGRNFTHPLSVGDTFTRSYRLIPPENVDRHTVPWLAVDEHPLELKVDRIQAYGASLETLSAGVTARLHLSGTGIDAVADGRILATR